MSNETREAKQTRPARQTATITCVTCGKQDEVPLPRFCNACFSMLRDRGKREASTRIKQATDASKRRVVVFDRQWLDDPEKEATKDD